MLLNTKKRALLAFLLTGVIGYVRIAIQQVRPHKKNKMAYIKKHFSIDQRVTFVKTGSSMDGLTGSILAKQSAFMTDDYIVGFDTSYQGQKAVSITEACLEQI